MEELDLSELIKPKSLRVWDYAVPIVPTGSGYKIYLTDQIGTPEYYPEACHVIEEARADQTIQLILNTPGGSAYGAFMLADAIKRSKAKVVARLSGQVASAGTIITMYCDEIQPADGLTFMIHNYSASYSGKANELKSLQKFSDDEMTSHFREIYTGFLTDDELDKVVDGNDHYMSTAEVVERWNKRKQPAKPKTTKGTA